MNERNPVFAKCGARVWLEADGHFRVKSGDDYFISADRVFTTSFYGNVLTLLTSYNVFFEYEVRGLRQNGDYCLIIDGICMYMDKI